MAKERPEDMFINDAASLNGIMANNPYINYMNNDTIKKSYDVENYLQDDRYLVKKLDLNQLEQPIYSFEQLPDRIIKSFNKVSKKKKAKRLSPNLRKALINKGMSFNQILDIEKSMKTNLPPNAILNINRFVDSAVYKGWSPDVQKGITDPGTFGATMFGIFGLGTSGLVGGALLAYLGFYLDMWVRKKFLTPKEGVQAAKGIKRSVDSMERDGIITRTGANNIMNSMESAIRENKTKGTPITSDNLYEHLAPFVQEMAYYAAKYMSGTLNKEKAASMGFTEEDRKQGDYFKKQANNPNANPIKASGIYGKGVGGYEDYLNKAAKSAGVDKGSENPVTEEGTVKSRRTRRTKKEMDELRSQQAAEKAAREAEKEPITTPDETIVTPEEKKVKTGGGKKGRKPQDVNYGKAETDVGEAKKLINRYSRRENDYPEYPNENLKRVFKAYKVYAPDISTKDLFEALRKKIMPRRLRGAGEKGAAPVTSTEPEIKPEAKPASSAEEVTKPIVSNKPTTKPASSAGGRILPNVIENPHLIERMLSQEGGEKKVWDSVVHYSLKGMEDEGVDISEFKDNPKTRETIINKYKNNEPFMTYFKKPAAGVGGTAQASAKGGVSAKPTEGATEPDTSGVTKPPIGKKKGTATPSTGGGTADSPSISEKKGAAAPPTGSPPMGGKKGSSKPSTGGGTAGSPPMGGKKGSSKPSTGGGTAGGPPMGGKKGTTKMEKSEVKAMNPVRPTELKKAIFSVQNAISLLHKEAQNIEDGEIKWLSSALEGGGLRALANHPKAGQNIGEAASKVGTKFLQSLQDNGAGDDLDNFSSKQIGLAILEALDAMVNDGGDEKIGKSFSGILASLVNKYGKKEVMDMVEDASEMRKAVAETIDNSLKHMEIVQDKKPLFSELDEEYEAENSVAGDGTKSDVASLTNNSKKLSTY